MSNQSIFQDLSYWFRVGLWRLVAPLIKALRLDRLLWKKYVSDRMISEGWQTALSEVEAHAPFFKAIEYRPKYNASFDQEKFFLHAAIAVANFHYFCSNLEAYRRSVERIGLYLNYVIQTNEYEVKQSDIWAEYLHAKATVEMIFGNPAIAACINSEVKKLYSQRQKPTLEEITYEHCTICCRMESLSADENYLLTAIDSQLKKLSDDLINFSSKAGRNPNDSELNTTSFYVAMLRCKAQMYMEKPDISILQENIQKAKKSKEFISGFDLETYNAIILLYEAILSMHKQDEVRETKKFYEAFLQAFEKRQNPHFCLMRIPDRILIDLANHVKKNRAFSNQTLKMLKRRKNFEFLSRVVILAILALLLPVFVNYFIIPLSQIGLGFVNEKSIWFLSLGLTTAFTSLIISWMKILAERFDRGLISPSVLLSTDIICSLYLALAIALIAAAASEMIK
jgi:hypothetical protein